MINNRLEPHSKSYIVPVLVAGKLLRTHIGVLGDADEFECIYAGEY